MEITTDFNPANLPVLCGDTITITFTATDDCGNTDICTATVTYDDNVAPEITCPANLEIFCAPGVNVTDEINTWIILATATDNCDTDVQITTDFNPANLPVLCGDPITITFTATDECGNTNICTATVTYDDNVAPEITCPANLDIICAPGVNVTDEINSWIALTSATDNCDTDVEITTDFNPANLPALCGDPIVVTFTATDDCGNTDICTATVTLDDDVAPVITCPAPLDITCTATTDLLAEINAWIALATATDNCDTDVEITTDFDPNNMPELCGDPITVTFTATDDCGNTNVCTTTVTLDDDVAPEITCPASLIITCTATTDLPAEINAWIALATATDNCDTNVEITADFNPANLPVLCGDPITITFTATDDCGNTTTCQANVALDDIENPIITCPTNLEIFCAPGVNVTDEINTWIALATATDNCDTDVEITTDFNPANLPVLCGDPITITFTATDDCGNVATCQANVTFDDNEAPTITCPASLEITCTATTDLLAEINAWIALATATDNCDTDVAITTDFNPANLPALCGDPITVTFTATDDCGNTAICQTNVTLDDNEAPTITCPANLEIICAPGVNVTDAINTWIILATATDNCDTDVDITTNFDPNNLPELCGDPITVTFTATDDCGNTATCTATIKLDDDIPPTFDEIPDNLDITCVSDLPALGSITATDNCSAAKISFTEVVSDSVCINTKTITRTWIAADDCGNSTTAIQIITIKDQDPPVFNPVPANLTLTCASDLPAPDAITATDNCGAVGVRFTQSVSDSTCVNHKTITRTWTATDTCGNTASVVQVITIDDSVPPVIVCPLDQVDCAAEPPAAYTSLAEFLLAGGQISDNCQLDSASWRLQTETITGAGYPEPYLITRIYTISDVCGNSNTCTQTISVPGILNVQASSPTLPAMRALPAELT